MTDGLKPRSTDVFPRPPSRRPGWFDSTPAAGPPRPPQDPPPTASGTTTAPAHRALLEQPHGSHRRSDFRAAASQAAQSLPQAAIRPTPRRLLAAADDLDRLRRAVWAPVTGSTPFQRGEQALQAHPRVRLAVRVAARGPVSLLIGHWRRKNAEPAARGPSMPDDAA
ncbi:hypothetical protein GT347_13350 [Xylophilus rhododendri]|uniref:Uncharacterized protein n=1 Tax=Xylophilus rhododendri TaxID=2697032 RepID=A0A857J735_9BURK|nr:hypothetical protein [Xylophilus rhododendri]QHI98889.1 hypothetical protein GT347_13350 [Xylophilus rhododendri]